MQEIEDSNKDLSEKCKSQTCENCELRKNNKCLMGNNLFKLNEGQICPVPKLQEKAIIYDMEVYDENVILKLLQSNLRNMMKSVESASHIKAIHDMLIQIKHEFYPNININKNMNLNYDVKKDLDEFFEKVEDINENENTNKK